MLGLPLFISLLRVYMQYVPLLMSFYVRETLKCTCVTSWCCSMIQGPPCICVARVIFCAHIDVIIDYNNTDIQFRTSLDVFLLCRGFNSITRINICTPFDVIQKCESNSPSIISLEYIFRWGWGKHSDATLKLHLGRTCLRSLSYWKRALSLKIDCIAFFK